LQPTLYTDPAFSQNNFLLANWIALESSTISNHPKYNRGNHKSVGGGKMAAMSLIFIGLNGSVAAIDRSTGTLVWATKLKGSDFVNVQQAEDEIYAATKGEIFCLDPGTGQIRWHNPLKGMGLGLVSIAGPGIQGNQAALVQKHKRDQEMAAAGAAAGAGGA
jgi:outer membrane protein assembly factor BamB